MDADRHARALSVWRTHDATGIIVDVEINSTTIRQWGYTIYSCSSERFQLAAKVMARAARGIEVTGISSVRTDQFHFMRRQAWCPIARRGDRPNMHENLTGNDFIDC